MSLPGKRILKNTLYWGTAHVYRDRPLASWPAFMGRLHDMTVPRSMDPNPSPLPVGSANINTLTHLIDQTRDVPGDIAECGVHKGGTLVPMAIHVHQKGIRKKLLGFDSFEGLPDSVAFDARLGGPHGEWKRPGEMSNTSVELVLSKLRRFCVVDNVELVKGFFEKTLPGYADRRFSLVHLDCDIYSSYKECIAFFYPRVNSGGVILLDEYNDPPWPGCNKAIDEFLRDKPEKLREIVFDNYQKYYIAKI
jgi:O-methyltransferase